MELAPGMLLLATPALSSGVFRRSVVVLLDRGDDGTLGVVLTRPGPRPAPALLGPQAERAAEPAVVFLGGPVQPEAVLAVGVDPDGQLAWAPVGPDAILPPGSLRVFTGYAGWGAGQLDGEVAAGAWWPVPARPADLLATRPERLWQTLVRRLPSPASFAATMPDDPRHN